MGNKTKIEWCDSTLNLQMGCNGCELWNGKVRKCYAGRQTEERAGFPGWPKAFDHPTLNIDRLSPAMRWKDLTGTEREEKPWLNKLPRIVFLNDMGDSFTEALPKNWLTPIMPLLAASPHQWLLLTKRPTRLLEFSRGCPLPPNVWPGTTVTSAKTLKRVEILAQIQTGGPKFISCEPMWEAIAWDQCAGMREIRWLILGGESAPEGEEATPLNPQWIADSIDYGKHVGLPVFVKQLGSNPVGYTLEDRHGGDWGEWPKSLQVREMPTFTHQPHLL